MGTVPNPNPPGGPPPPGRPPINPPVPCAEAPGVKSVEDAPHVYQKLCERAAQIIKCDTRNPQIEKWFEDYEATL